MGLGVILLDDTPKNTFLDCILGTFVNAQTTEQRDITSTTFDASWPLSWQPTWQERGMPDVFYNLDTSVYCNAMSMVNHSCRPNAAFYIMWHEGSLVVAAFSLRFIRANEFLSFHYWPENPEEVKVTFPQGCLCQPCVKKRSQK